MPPPTAPASPPSPAPGPAELSVVIITRDRAPELRVTLERIQRLLAGPGEPRPCPVLVVDNGSTDGSAAMVGAEFPGVGLICLPGNLGGAARNVGVALAATEYVAFCDDDTWWAPGSLAAAVDALRRRPRLAVVTARIVVEPGGRTDAISEEMGRSPLPAGGHPAGAPLLSFLAGASVVRRRAFQGVGGFPGHFVIGGEEEIAGADLVDAGWEMAYRDDVVIHHRASGARDPHLRRRQGIRNTLWFTWARRPLGPALARTAGLASSLPRDLHSLRAIAAAAGGAGWVMAHRRAVRAPVEAGLALLDADHARSEARRYVS